MHLSDFYLLNPFFFFSLYKVEVMASLFTSQGSCEADPFRERARPGSEGLCGTLHL